jgi:SPP1 gp7 family putative phage head morphogenesis protein
MLTSEAIAYAELGRIFRLLNASFTELALWGVWFKNRNTPAVVTASDRGDAIKKARATKCAGWDEAVVSCRQLKGKSLEQAKKGNWVRERANGSEEGGSFKYRPQLKPNHAEGDDFLTSEDAYEELVTSAFHVALDKSILSIKDSLSAKLDWEALYPNLDTTVLSSALAQANLLGLLVGMYSERPDREETEFADDPTRLPFNEAIAYFRQKLNIPTRTWKDIQGAENDWAFAIAGVTGAEMLQDFRMALDRYIADGTGFAQFAKEFDAIAQNFGWQPKEGIARKADLVAKTNFRMAYAAGQWQQRQDPLVKQLRPGLMWRHRDSPNERPHHKAMDGMIFDGNDPQYSGLVGFSGFGCRCRLFSVPAPDRGFDVLSQTLPYQFPDGKTGEVPAVKVGEKLFPVADPGFFYTPGASPKSARPHLFQQMLGRQPPAWQKLIRRAIPQRILRAFTPKGFN